MESLHAWAAILAGGNGSRLSTLTRTLAGDDRPKQFCSLLGTQTLVGGTAQRIDTLVAPHRTLYIVTAAHRAYYRQSLRTVPRHLVLEQPANRGTAVAVAWSVQRVREADPNAVLGVFPSDHHYDNPLAFRSAVLTAYQCAAVDRERVFLLGVAADRPEEGYGWITPGGALPRTEMLGRGAPRSVASFIEKPTREEAQALFEYRCLWNTFVLVGHVDAYRAVIEAACGDLMTKIEAASAPGTFFEEAFDALPTADFSKEVLARFPERLGVIPVFNSGWTDLGEPSRVLALMASRLRPSVARREAS